MNKAFLFDLNGTLINDMHYHITAWHKVLNNLGANISMENMRKECYGKGEELIERILPGRFSWTERHAISIEKEAVYRQEFRPHLHLLPGAAVFLQAAFDAGIPMAIGSAAPELNVAFVLDGMDIRRYFSAIITADDVQHSKPHPETFLLCAHALHMPPAQCLVFEDSPMGVEAATRGGMKSVVLTTLHSANEFETNGSVIAAGNDFTEFSVIALSAL